MAHLRGFMTLAAASMLVPGAALAQPAPPPPTGPAQPLEYAAKIVCGRGTGDNDR
jgi:hypothetical protein